VAVTVENCGDYAADESVPVFLRDEVASIPQPQKKLVAIGALTLAPEETATAEVLIPTEALTFTNARMERVLEPGWFTVMAGGLEARVQI
jgi:beta-glucosidase